MRLFLLLPVFILSGISAIAQIITLKDKDTNEPLESAVIQSKSPKGYKITNAEGQADISAFEGSAEIIIRLINYKPVLTSYGKIKESGFLVEMEPSQIFTEPVIVSATKWDRPASEMPVRITVVTSRDVALQNPQTAADLLTYSGEVFIQKSQQGGGSPMIRGFSTNRLLYSVDGIRMNTAIFRSGNLQNVISLDPFAIDHSEVLFGPGSVIYGSDAIGGVMSFTTLQPQFSVSEEDEPYISGKAVARYSSANNEKTAHMDMSIGWEKFAMVTSITTNDYGHLRMGSNGPDDYLRPFYTERIDGEDVIIANDDELLQFPTGFTQKNLMQKFAWKPNDNWELQYGLHYSETSDFPRYDRHIRLRNGIPRSGEWRYGPQVWAMNNLSINHNLENFLYDEATLRLALQNFEESRFDRDWNDAIRYERVENVDAYSANLDFARRIDENSELFYGLELVINEVNSKGTDTDISIDSSYAGPSRYPEATWASYAAYMTYMRNLTEKFKIQAGARYNTFSLDAYFTDNLAYYPFPEAETSTGSGALTGSLGLVYNPVKSWTISANASTGFRSPNVDDMGKVFDSEPGSVVVPNPGLDAEYAYNFDIGMAKTFGEWLKLDFTGFYTILENAMVRRDYTLNGQDSIIYDGELSKVQAIQNAAEATVYGVQAGVEIKLPLGFGISSQFNYQHGEEELDDGSTSPSRHAAPWFGITRLEYKAKRLGMQLYAIYNGEKSFEDMPVEETGKGYLYAADEDGNPYSPAWYTLNFKAQYRLDEVFTIVAGMENITDKRYRPYSSGLTAAGRNFILSLRANF